MASAAGRASLATKWLPVGYARHPGDALRLVLDAVLAAGSIYLIVKLVKEFVQRGRPQTLLDGINILGEPARGLGYVSGHSAVAVALATVASPYLGRRGRRVAWALAAAVCVARVYVGAHLPLDVVGGAALGWAAGALTQLILGAPDGRPSLKRVRKALEAHGLDAGDLEPVKTDFRNSSTYVTGGDDGLFVKAVGREWRDTDLLYRTWRALARRRSPRLRFALPLRKVEHEASMALLAASAGVRAPRVLLVREFGYGAGLLVERRIHGRSLADLDPGEVGDALLAECWRQVSLLHEAGIAHGDLDPANLMVDDRGQPWLVDFDQALHAGEELQAVDVRTLLNGLTGLVGADRAKVAAEAALGRDALEAPAPKGKPVPA